MSNKVQENRVRRLASRIGSSVCKSRRRDDRVADYGLYQVFDDRNFLKFSSKSLDDIEWYLRAFKYPHPLFVA
jgi:hypothetical protein